jgi:hypothetical protein
MVPDVDQSNGDTPHNHTPYEIFYNLYKPATPYRKTAPPSPEFSVVVIKFVHLLFYHIPNSTLMRIMTAQGLRQCQLSMSYVLSLTSFPSFRLRYHVKSKPEMCAPPHPRLRRNPCHLPQLRLVLQSCNVCSPSSFLQHICLNLRNRFSSQILSQRSSRERRTLSLPL